MAPRKPPPGPRAGQPHQSPTATAFLQASLQGALICAEGRVLEANEPLAALLGAQDAAALHGIALTDLFQQAPQLRPDSPTDHTLQATRTDGSTIDLQGRAAPLAVSNVDTWLLTVLPLPTAPSDSRSILSDPAVLQSVMDAVPHGFTIKDLHGRYIAVNQTIAKLFCCPPEGMIGRTTTELNRSPPEIIKQSEAAEHTAMQRGETAVANLTEVPYPDGSIVYQRLTKFPLSNSAGSIIGTIGLAENLTKQTEAERKSSISSGILQSILDVLPHAIHVKDEKGCYLMVNRAQAEVFGGKPEDFLGKSHREFSDWPDDVNDEVEAMDRVALETGQPVRREVLRSSPHQADQRQRVTKASFYIPETGLRGLVGIAEDVTEQYEAQREVEESRHLLQTIIDTVPHAIFLKDAQRRFQVVNLAHAELFGLSPREVIGLQHRDLPHVTSAKAQITEAQDMQVLRDGQAVELAEIAFQSHRGELILEVTRIPFHGPTGEITGVLGVAQDITERREVERRVREGRRLLQVMIDAVPISLFLKDNDGRLRVVNECFARYYSQSPQALIGLRVEEIIGFDFDLSALTIHEDRAVAATAAALEPVEMELRRPNGPSRYHLRSKYPLLDESGQVVGIVGVSEDITQRRLQREMLIARSEILQQLAAGAGLPELLAAIIAKTERLWPGTHCSVQLLDRETQLLGDVIASGLPVQLLQAVTGLPLATDSAPCAAAVIADEPVFAPSIAGYAQAPKWREAALSAGYRASWSHPIPSAQGAPLGSLATYYEHEHEPDSDEIGFTRSMAHLAGVAIDRSRTNEALRAGEERYRTLIESSVLGVAIEQDHRVVFANQALADIFGYDSPEQMVALESLDPLYPPEERELIRAYYHARKEGRSPPTRYEIRALKKNGEEFWYQVVANAVIWDGRFAVQATLSDVTERRRAEESARADRRLLETTLDLIPMWVFLKNRERQLLMINRKMADDLNLPNSGVVAQPSEHLRSNLSPQEAAVMMQLDQQVLRTGETVETPLLIRTLPDGEVRYFRSIRVPLRDEQGAIVGLVGLNEDITERRQQEQALQQAQKLESLGVIAGGVAHDFNNLLTTIMGHAALAERHAGESSAMQSALARIRAAGQQAADLCTQMLAYAGEGDIQRSHVELGRLVREMAQLLEVSLGATIVLRYDFPEDLPRVLADASQLRQVVMNLVINASDAIGDAPGTITLRARVEEHTHRRLARYVGNPNLQPGTYLRLSVKDDGCGMDEQTIARIFDPFFSTKFTGRGLGLASVLGILRGHGGALRVQSTVGKGTEFLLLLPIANPDAQPDTASATPTVAPTPAATVLIVDDQASLREVATEMLETLGYRVVSAADGAEALDVLEERAAEIALVLLDIAMPGMTGDAVCRIINERWPQVIVLPMSGHSKAELRHRFQGLSTAGYLPKPFDMGTLERGVLAALTSAPADWTSR